MASAAHAPARLTPGSAAEAAAMLRDAGPVVIRGGGTKLGGLGFPVDAPTELRTERLDALVAHNAGDMTAVVQAGLPLARAQAAFADAGQMLALDPPDGGATVGGVVASGDSGPLRHRYGAPRDLVLGVELALPDGSVARAGSQVIKNVAGYDLAKLMSGACGTLGLLCELTVRLHPLPARCCTVVGRGDDPAALAAAATALAHLPLEADAIDLRWEGAFAGAGADRRNARGAPRAAERGAAGGERAAGSGAAGETGRADGAARGTGGAPGAAATGDGAGGAAAGAVLARFSGATARDRAEVAARTLREHGLACAAVEDDGPLWAAQRDGQRGAVVLRVSGTQARLAGMLAVARDEGARLVARAAYGLAWLTLPGGGGNGAGGANAIGADAGSANASRTPAAGVNVSGANAAGANAGGANAGGANAGGANAGGANAGGANAGGANA
ncbi:FAD-binding oxidoreductase, partial [Conexibacter arvalis]